MSRGRTTAALLVGGAVALLAGQAIASFTSTAGSAGNTFAAAATFCSSGSTTVSSDADSWLEESSPASTHGSDDRLQVKSKSSDDMRLVVRFTLPTLPAGCQLTGATLRLHCIEVEGTRTLDAYRVAATWSEGTVTWSNQPATTGSPAQTTSALGWRSWSVTAQVAAMYAGTNFGFLVRDATENSSGFRQRFDAREAASNRPELVVAYG